jgi:hypothetical protein
VAKEGWWQGRNIAYFVLDSYNEFEAARRRRRRDDSPATTLSMPYSIVLQIGNVTVRLDNQTSLGDLDERVWRNCPPGE